MKKTIILTSLIGFMYTVSCTKEKPITGHYYGTFNYDVPQGIIKTAEIEITESSKDKIVIN